MLNYKLGDVVRLSATPCGCKRTLPTIETIDGRADDFVMLPGGHRIHGLVVLGPIFRVPGVVQAQFIQEGLQRYVLRVVCAASVEWPTVSRDLHAAGRTTLGDGFALEIARADVILPASNGKFRPVIARVRQ